MQKSFAPETSRLIALLPFGYAFVSRYHWPRDFVVNALTAWVPGIILVSVLGGLTIGPAVFAYLLGYTAFICLYEVGYLANDSYGLKHDPTPRPRVTFKLGAAFATLFVLIRLSVFLTAIWALGVSSNAVYWGAVLALIATLVAHNCLHAVELKFYTFLQLSLLRFALPALPVLLAGAETGPVLTLFAVGLCLFTLPRFLTYLDAKGRLELPERKARSYHLKAHLAVAPTLVFVSLLTSSPAALICLAWALLVQSIYIQRGQALDSPVSNARVL
ncbi:hypothetical protein [Aliiroseovarius sp. 2305UL8-7]|uniref:hypothetical protein n=1 Tax=Aliiroseovarius conchicola TaxID=3121637 RepID=UPI003528943A